jgi:hypothetical protein
VPARPDPRKPSPQDSITVAKAWAFQLLLQNRNLLSQREVLGRRFRPVPPEPTNEQHQDANQARFTASETWIAARRR